ncbi:hypothetical protein Rs2_40074 [Raphanus sativus]|nr:hypothetical protein Rs2_40074 [Raphanus sativus]
MCDEFVKLWTDQKELADLHLKIPTMYRHRIGLITAHICIARGTIVVNCETRFAKLTMVGKDRYRVTMDVHKKVLLERSRFFMEKISCRREKRVSHMMEISEYGDVEIYVVTVFFMYCDDLKKKLVGDKRHQDLGFTQAYGQEKKIIMSNSSSPGESLYKVKPIVPSMSKGRRAEKVRIVSDTEKKEDESESKLKPEEDIVGDIVRFGQNSYFVVNIFKKEILELGDRVNLNFKGFNKFEDVDVL